jgi:hypothetical protein
MRAFRAALALFWVTQLSYWRGLRNFNPLQPADGGTHGIPGGSPLGITTFVGLFKLLFESIQSELQVLF